MKQTTHQPWMIARAFEVSVEVAEKQKNRGKELKRFEWEKTGVSK